MRTPFPAGGIISSSFPCAHDRSCRRYGRAHFSPWNDFYGFATFIPWWVSAIALVPVSLLIATGIRALHNRSRDRRKAEETAFFTETFAGADVRKIIAAMARSRSSAKVLDIVVPTRVISILIRYSGSDCTMEEAAQIYLKEYIECSGVMNLDRFWI